MLCDSLLELPGHYFYLGFSADGNTLAMDVIPHLCRVVRAAVGPWLLNEADTVCEPLTRAFAAFPLFLCDLMRAIPDSH